MRVRLAEAGRVKSFGNIDWERENAGNRHFVILTMFNCPTVPPGWLSSERVGLMTWWL